MKQDWKALTDLIKDQEMLVTRVEMPKKEIAIEGKFELPPLAKLSMEDQLFVAAFVKTHGSIKEMERLFGVSYPTIKNRLNKISKGFSFLNIEEKKSKESLLDLLKEGKISVEEALKEMQFS